jgi:hypothetical protein
MARRGQQAESKLRVHLLINKAKEDFQIQQQMSKQRNANLNPKKSKWKTEHLVSDLQNIHTHGGQLNTWSVIFKRFTDMSGWDQHL